MFGQGTNIGLLAQKLFPSCIFTGKFENFDFESCNHIFTSEVKSIVLATNVLKSGKNKKEVKNDPLSMMAPPIIQSCSTTQSNSELSFVLLTLSTVARGSNTNSTSVS